MKKKIAIACGGTGGHLFPGMAVAEELKKNGHHVLLIVSKKQIDKVSLGTENEADSVTLNSIGWPGVSFKALHFFYYLIKDIFECKKLFQCWKPDAVLGMGGFTSAVPLMHYVRNEALTFLHESNAYPGKVTKMYSGKLDKILLGFFECKQHLKFGEKIEITGTPVRKSLYSIPKKSGYEKIQLNPDKKTLLIMGGSQGAHAINELVIKTLPLISNRRDQWQFVHLTGPNDVHLVEFNYRREKFDAVVKDFSSDMPSIYSIADLAISRSGASSISELVCCSIPSILIPYPYAADNHQFYNARVIEQAGAAIMVEESRMTPEKLRGILENLFDDEVKIASMIAACQRFEFKNSAKKIADTIQKYFN